MGIGERIRVAGNTQLVEFDEAITNYEASLSISETAQFTIKIADDAADQLLVSRYLHIGADFDVLRFDGKVLLPLEIAAEESSESKGGPSLTVVARAKGIQRLKWIKGPLILDNLTDTAFVKKMCARVGLTVKAQETGGDLHAVGLGVPGNLKENAWDAIKRLAERNGYIVFEAQNVLYFGKPTWMITNLPTRVMNVSPDDARREPGILGRPRVRRSADDKGRPVTVTIECLDSVAEAYRPGMVLVLQGMPVFSGHYLISESRWTKAGTGTVTAITPVDPEVSRPATEAERMGVGTPGGAPAGSPAAAGGATGATGVITMDDFLYGLRTHESNNNYKAQSPISSASGAYQYINSTWNNYQGYARAKDAPPSVQDQRARQDAAASHKRYNGDWEKVAAYHFYPKWANNKSLWGQSPSPGNPTIRTYVDSVIGKARAKAGVRPPTASANNPSGQWVWPTTTRRVTSEFGPRIHPITGKRKLHAGMDVGVPTGTAVFAAKPGKVTVAGAVSGYGIAVYLDHGGGLFTRYAHLSRVGVNVGQQVRLGERIATSGATGNVTGAHLHFEVRPNNVPANPRNFLPK